MRRNNFLAIALIALLFSACAPVYKTAKERFELGEFNASIPMFEEALKKSQHEHEKGKINFYIAESYRLSNRIEEAVPYYETALEEKYYEDKLAFYYAEALKAAGRYEDAAKQYDAFAKTGSDYALVKRAKEQLTNMQAIDSLSKPHEYMKITNLAGINSTSADYAPVLWKDKIVFSSTRNASEIYEATGGGFSDLFVIDTTELNSEGATVEPLSSNINTNGFHEATAAFTNDGKTVIFARSNSGKKDEKNLLDVNLFTSDFSDEDWSEAKLLVDVVNTKKWDGTPAFSVDGKSLYFASDRSGGFGGLDIYVTKMNDRGEWSRPRNLGKEINTAGNELFPHVSKDGKLYFSSDGHPGLGRLDIFEAVRVDGEITVRNLGAPINSTADDFGFISLTEKSGIFTSDRKEDGAKGEDDIYHFVDETPEIKIVQYYLAGLTYEDSDDKKSILPEVKLTLQTTNGATIDETVSDADGAFRFPKEVSVDMDYRIVGDKGDDYLKHTTEYSTIGKAVDPTTLEKDTTEIVFNTEVTLKIKRDEIKILDSIGTTEVMILYDLNKANIRPDAAKILDDFVEYLKTNDKKIELGSHTDARGRADYNMELSERRADSAVAYIVSKGIDRDRLVAKGYGETDLAVKNARTTEEHQKNRRTTIRVIKEEEE